MPTRSTDSPRGRPRSAERDAALIAATQRLLAEEGYDLLSMGAVAEAAGASKNTLYRRWPDKRSLALDAIAALGAVPAEEAVLRLPLRDALLRLLQLWREEAPLRDRIVVGVLPALLRDPELRAGFVAVLHSSRERIVASAIDAAVQRGEISVPPSVDRIAALPGAVEMVTFVRTGHGMEQDDGEALVDEVLLPLLGVRTRHGGGA